MNRRHIIILAATLVSIPTWGQEITYNHDPSKLGQIMVMELGAGSLTPEIYYRVTHNSYRKGAKAPTSVKNTLRTATQVASLPQVDMADSIQSDLESRAKIEAMNIADREIDFAWLTEGEKINSRLMAFKNNLNGLAGKASSEEITAWGDLAKMYDFAIKTIRKSYMPNSERQKQYLAIYDEITATNDKLILRVRFLATKQRADRIVTSLARFQHRVGENATAAYNRWRDNGLKAKTTTKDNNIITP